MYYVGFSTATIVASLILFQGFNTTDTGNTFSLLAGFIVTFLGVHLLNLSRRSEPPPLDVDGNHQHSALEGGLMNPRLSLQGRMSMDGWDRAGMDINMGPTRANGAARHGRQSSIYRSQTTTLFNAFEHEDPDAPPSGNAPRRSNGHARRSSTVAGGDPQRLEGVEESDDEDDFEEAGAQASLLKKKRHQNGGKNVKSLVLGQPRSAGSSRSQSHSPPDSSLTDVRITPRT